MKVQVTQIFLSSPGETHLILSCTLRERICPLLKQFAKSGHGKFLGVPRGLLEVARTPEVILKGSQKMTWRSPERHV